MMTSHEAVELANQQAMTAAATAGPEPRSLDLTDGLTVDLYPDGVVDVSVQTWGAPGNWRTVTLSPEQASRLAGAIITSQIARDPSLAGE